ncbi:MAG: P1 family peptidase [Proteobacteria bacterium]|nr:P1 family peptidase [Pseudomonadota bacterium]
MKQVPQRFFCFLFTFCYFIIFPFTSFAKVTQNLLQFDFPEIQIGEAVNPKGPTGITLFYFPKGAQAAVDIRGGSVGTFFTQEKMHQGEAYIDGIAFSGGGILGMEAIAGIVSSLFAKENQTHFSKMPLISGAVIFDYTPRKNAIYPDKSLGEAAFANLKKGEFTLGQHGVGVAASNGKLFGDSFTRTGQGAAFAQIGKTKIAVFTVVNAVGIILDEKGNPVHGMPQGIKLSDLHEKSQYLLTQEKLAFSPGMKNTTLTLVVTNEMLSSRHLQQLGRQVHHALSQVIYPYATILDGDVLYTVSTGSVKSDLYSPGTEINSDLNAKLFYLGMVAGELAKKAVWSCVGYERLEQRQ